MDKFNELFGLCRSAFNQKRTFERARRLGIGLLTCFGRHTITGLLTATGQQFLDWSAAYRLFNKKRMDTTVLFDVARQSAIGTLPKSDRIIVHMDDTLIHKKGKKIPDAGWRRDPQGPPFRPNFVWAQRFVQISLAIYDQLRCCQSKAIPIDFHHAPPAKRPTRFSKAEEVLEYKEQQPLRRLSYQGSLRIRHLRKKLDEDGHKNKNLCVCVDGSYSNHTVIKGLPSRTTLIGRIRKDTKLYARPGRQTGKGRKKVYGEQMPTPKQILDSNDYAFKKVKAWAAGKVHDFKVKVIQDLKWRSAGERHLVQLIVIHPLGYRLTKTSNILYRDPTYLICTENNMDINEVLQAYLWRWEIEVNFRDEKTLLGCGQAQVRTSEAVAKAPAFSVAMYAFLHLASKLTSNVRDQSILARPKWDPANEKQRLSTMEIVNQLRLQVWAKSIKNNFSGFVDKLRGQQSPRNCVDPLLSAAFYLRK